MECSLCVLAGGASSHALFRTSPRQPCCPRCGRPALSDRASSQLSPSHGKASMPSAAAASVVPSALHALPARGTDLFGSTTTGARAASTSHTTSRSAATFGSPPRFLRDVLEESTPLESFKVKGVTFEGRQDVVCEMVKGEPVLLLRQPWNKFDSKAVGVKTLEGKQAGFVPQVINHGFQHHDIVMGCVQFVGQEPTSGNWGVRVAAQPELMSAYVSPFEWSLIPGYSALLAKGCPKTDGEVQAAVVKGKGPAASGQLPAEAVAGMAALQAALGSQRWQQLTADAMERSEGVCEVTAASKEVTTLHFVPEWHLDEDKRTVQLRRLALVSHDVAMVRFALDVSPGPGSPDFDHVLVVLKDLILLNGWDRSVRVTVILGWATTYLQAVERQRTEMAEGGWTLAL